MRGKSILRDRPGVLWLLGLAVLGLGIAYVISISIHGAEKMVRVYVAAQTIPDDTLITAKELESVSISASVVPSGVIKDPHAIMGRYADAPIAKGAPILESDVAPASTVRELVRTYGMDFVGATVQLDPSDLPVSDVTPGDLVDLVGVYGTQNQNVFTQWIALGVPVLSVDTTNAKIVLAVPKENAPDLVRDLTTGKVRVMLDPNPFQGAITFQSTGNPSSGGTAASQSPTSGGAQTGAGALQGSTLPPGQNALANAKGVQTAENSQVSTSK